MTDDEAKKEIADARDWWQRGPWNKIIIGAAITVIGGTAWAGLSAVAGVPSLESEVEANTSDISSVERTLNDEVVPTLEKIDTQTDHIEKDVDRLSSEVDKVEKRQHEADE